jgi:dihydropteroate synthase
MSRRQVVYQTVHGSLAFDGATTHVMGVINLSPESKNPQTIATEPSDALAMARRYRDWGASVIDLGAQSSHHENPTLASEEEISRLLPSLELLADDGFIVSVDTWKPEVAAAALECGASILNDTGGLARPEMRRLVAEREAVAIVMYLEGDNPHAVSELTISGNKAEMTAKWMKGRIEELQAEAVDHLIVDPGISINYPGDYAAYTKMQLDVIRDLHHLQELGYPVMIPIPRKREDHRVAAYITMALEHGADLIRSHDVEWACDLVELFGRTPAESV